MTARPAVVMRSGSSPRYSRPGFICRPDHVAQPPASRTLKQPSTSSTSASGVSVVSSVRADVTKPGYFLYSESS